MAESEPRKAEIEEWAQGLEELHGRIASRFVRTEPRERVLAYLRGLLSPVERKNSWQLAEKAGEAIPDGMQRLLSTARWDANGVRDDLVSYVKESLSEPGAILVIAEMVFLKKGKKSAGVDRQSHGTASKRENCQIGMFVAYSTSKSHVLLDRELYLPQEWIEDWPRRREAGIPDAVEFATKPELIRCMLQRLWTGGLEATWVTGDEVYGESEPLRVWLENQQQAYVLALAVNDGVDLPWNGVITRIPVHEVLTPAITSWHRFSAGEGAKGTRWYDWALVPLAKPKASWGHWLLVRRSLQEPDMLAAYLVFAPQDTLLETMVALAYLAVVRTRAREKAEKKGL